MTKYVALIRGIGPGDPQKTNEKLRGVMEGLGFTNVQSVISSGNIVFESPETNVRLLENAIEIAWPKALGFQAMTIVRSQEQLQAVMDQHFFDGMKHSASSYMLVTFFKKASQPPFEMPYQPPCKPYQILGYADGVLYSVADNSTAKTTDLMVWLEKQFTKDITSRTPLTIQRIIKKMG